MDPLIPTTEELGLALLLFVVTACYLVYHYALDAKRWLPRGARPGDDPDLALRAMAIQRVGGALVLSLPPLLFAWAMLGLSPADLGLRWPAPLPLALYVAILGGIVVGTVALASRRPGFGANYPELRLPPHAWTPSRVRRQRLLWGIYLAGYETLFRGVLLFGLIPFVGVWPAIAIQTALYAAVHLPKNAGECAGSAVAGTLFSVGALLSGSVIAPFLLHWIIATAAETFGLRAQLVKAPAGR